MPVALPKSKSQRGQAARSGGRNSAASSPAVCPDGEQRGSAAASWPGPSFRFGRTIRSVRGTRRDGRARHRADNGDGTTVCLRAGRHRLRSFRLRRFRSRKEIDKGGPKSCRGDDESASEPAHDLPIAFVTEEPPQPIYAPELAFGNVGLRNKFGCTFSDEVNTIHCTKVVRPFETTDQSVHIIVK